MGRKEETTNDEGRILRGRQTRFRTSHLAPRRGWCSMLSRLLYTTYQNTKRNCCNFKTQVWKTKTTNTTKDFDLAVMRMRMSTSTSRKATVTNTNTRTRTLTPLTKTKTIGGSFSSSRCRTNSTPLPLLPLTLVACRSYQQGTMFPSDT